MLAIVVFNWWRGVTVRGCGLHHVVSTGVMKMSLSSVENWDTHQLVCLKPSNYDLFTNV